MSEQLAHETSITVMLKAAWKRRLLILLTAAVFAALAFAWTLPKAAKPSFKRELFLLQSAPAAEEALTGHYLDLAAAYAQSGDVRELTYNAAATSLNCSRSEFDARFSVTAHRVQITAVFEGSGEEARAVLDAYADKLSQFLSGTLTVLSGDIYRAQTAKTNIAAAVLLGAAVGAAAGAAVALLIYRFNNRINSTEQLEAMDVESVFFDAASAVLPPAVLSEPRGKTVLFWGNAAQATAQAQCAALKKEGISCAVFKPEDVPREPSNYDLIFTYTDTLSCLYSVVRLTRCEGVLAAINVRTAERNTLKTALNALRTLQIPVWGIVLTSVPPHFIA